MKREDPVNKLEEAVTMERSRIKNLSYITHIGHWPSIFQRGILSHERVEREKSIYAHIRS